MAEPFHLDPKKEKVFLLIAGLASILGFAFYVRAQQQAAAAAAGGTDPNAVGSSGTDTTGMASQGVSDWQNTVNGALTTLTQGQQTLSTGLAQVQNNDAGFLAALQHLEATQGTASGPGSTADPMVSFDLSVSGSTNDNNNGSWNKTGSGSSASSEAHSGGGSGSGGLNVFGLFSIGGGGKSSNSEQSSSSSAYATGDAGTYNKDQATTFGQSIKFTESGLDADTLYNLTNEMVDTSKRAQTAAVNPKGLATPYLFRVPLGSLITNPGQFGWNRPSPAQYSQNPSNVNRDAWYNNWGLQTTSQLPPAAYAGGSPNGPPHIGITAPL